MYRTPDSGVEYRQALILSVRRTAHFQSLNSSRSEPSKDGSVGVGLVKSQTSWERLAKAGHQGGGRQMGVARRRHRALAALRRGQHLGKRRAFGVFSGSGGSRVRESVTEEGIDPGEISDAIVGHSEVALKLAYSG